jgi:hypothetical protein
MTSNLSLSKAMFSSLFLPLADKQKLAYLGNYAPLIRFRPAITHLYPARPHNVTFPIEGSEIEKGEVLSLSRGIPTVDRV